MGIRRVVTGHTPDGKAVVASDDVLEPFAIGDEGASATLVWGRDEPARFPDDGRQPRMAAAFPPPGGCAVAVTELAPDGDDFHNMVHTGLAQWADPDNPGMHRTATIDYDVVLAGTVGLEVDDGVEVTLGPGDVVVQNGTRHRWHNRGNTIARMMSVTIGAHHELEGGSPVS